MRRKIIVVIVLLTRVIITTCGNNQTISDLSNQGIAGDLPLLKGVKKVGMIVGFNPSNPPQTEDSINTRWEEYCYSRVGYVFWE